MNKDELLRIYSAYLPHDLKVIRNGEKDEEQLYGVQIHWHKSYIVTEFNEYYLEDVKPLLYDLSYLTKEIEHEGERLIVMEKLYQLRPFDCSFHEMADHIAIQGIEMLQYWIYEILLKYHFNIFNIPKYQFINKATLKHETK